MATVTFFEDIGRAGPAGIDKAVQAVMYSDFDFTSVLTVQAHQRVNVGIMVGSQVSDILSAGAFSGVYPGTAISAIFSTASMSITLQRQYPENTDYWHDVDSWSVTVAQAEASSSENISDKPEPEPMMYRLGVKTGGYENGLALVRLGTS